MRYLLFLIICIAISYITFAQSPQSFQYQAVVRDVNEVALQNQSVGFQLSIISGSPTGTIEYVETHTATTNNFGIVTLIVGGGTTTDNFASISWGSAPHFIKVEADLGSGYLDMGTTQLLSVPYALYSENAGNVTTYTAGSGISITGNVIDNTSPDQTVNITGSGATSVTGTYPNFTISSTDNINDADADPTNEIQILSISNDTLYLSNGGSVFMGNYSDTLWKKSGNSIYNTNSENVGVGINNPVGRMVVQGSPTALATDPLFEVKNSFGQSVFVVWQDSVQVFINDEALQSNRGGFAVSGRNTSKAFTNNYFKVTPDSSRIWTKNPLAGFGVQSINGSTKANYMKLTPDNYFIGHESGININVGGGGLYNNCYGYQAGLNTTTGNSNNAIGYQALYNNTIGSSNVANGYQALYFNTSGGTNVANGYKALYYNNANNNVANGYMALYNNTTGSLNVANGYQALYSNTTGNYNVANGYQSLFYNTTGVSNVADGYQALYSNTSGGNNVANGTSALYSNTTGSGNIANGMYSLYFNTIGYSNTTSGTNSLYFNTTGNGNTANGEASLFNNNSGNYNTAYGYSSLYSNTTGTNNTALGNSAFYNGATYNNSTALGANAVITASNQVSLGNASITTFYCQGAYAATTALAANMYVSAAGQIMRSTSSIRYKKNVENLTINTEDIYKLRPVSYISIMDNKPYFGLIAEEVAEVIPGLAEYAKEKDVIKDSDSEKLIPDAVQYPMLSVLLLTEVQKHQKKINELNAKNDDLQKQINELKALINK